MKRHLHQWIGCLALASTTFAAQDSIKPTPVPPPDTGDVKTEWTPPVKTPAAPETAPARRHPAPKDGAPHASPSTPTHPDWMGAADSVFDDDRLYFDEPGDGRLWVRGRSYKASFGPDGATFVPYLGAQAPRNYPVRLSLESAVLGGQPIELSWAAPTRTGNRIACERGSLTEVYDVELDSIEQKFVLESLPRAGELVLSVAVDTELTKAEAPGKLVFEGEHGRVDYSRAIALDDAGARLPLETTLVGSRVEIRVPAEFLANATLPLVVDPVLTTVAVDSGGSEDFSPDVAYDSQNDLYLLVYERIWSDSDHDIYSVFYDPATGQLSDGEYLDFTTDDWRRPRVANNRLAMNFLVVASEGPVGSRVVSARIRHANLFGIMLPQFTVSADPSHDNYNPDVGGDPVAVGPTYFSVVWQRRYSSTDHDVHARLVYPDGSVFGAPIMIDNSGGTIDKLPSISKSNGPAPFSTQRWTVAWQREFSSVDDDIRAAQLSWDGDIVTSSFAVDSSGWDDSDPMASSPLDDPSGAERNSMIVFQREDGTLRGVVVRGDQVVESHNLDLVNGDLGGTHVWPSIDARGSVITLAYSEIVGAYDYDLYAVSYSYTAAGGLELIRSRTPVQPSSARDNHVELSAEHGASTSGRAMIVWRRKAFADDSDIQAAAWDPGQPDNDACADAESIAGLGTFPFSLVGATTDGPASSACGGSSFTQQVYRDVWFAWVAPTTGQFSVRTCGGSSTDTKLAVYAGSGCPTGSPIACNDDSCGLRSQVAFDAIGGEAIMIRLGLFSPGNLQEAGTFDIVLIGAGSTLGVPYCISAENSVSAAGSHVSASGSTSVSANDLLLSASPTPPGRPGLFYFGTAAVQTPLGNGIRCVGGSTYRIKPILAPATETASLAVDLDAAPASGVIQSGTTFYFQWWHRDPAAGGAAFNLSNGLELSFLP